MLLLLLLKGNDQDDLIWQRNPHRQLRYLTIYPSGQHSIRSSIHNCSSEQQFISIVFETKPFAPSLQSLRQRCATIARSSTYLCVIFAEQWKDYTLRLWRSISPFNSKNKTARSSCLNIFCWTLLVLRPKLL